MRSSPRSQSPALYQEVLVVLMLEFYRAFDR